MATQIRGKEGGIGENSPPGWFLAESANTSYWLLYTVEWTHWDLFILPIFSLNTEVSSKIVLESSFWFLETCPLHGGFLHYVLIMGSPLKERFHCNIVFPPPTSTAAPLTCLAMVVRWTWCWAVWTTLRLAWPSIRPATRRGRYGWRVESARMQSQVTSSSSGQGRRLALQWVGYSVCVCVCACVHT